MKKKKDISTDEKWRQEAPGLYEDGFFSDFVENDPNEEREVEAAYRSLKSRQRENKPTKYWKWKPKGLILSNVCSVVGEYLLICIVTSFFIRLGLNINLSLINMVSISFSLLLLKRWIKN